MIKKIEGKNEVLNSIINNKDMTTIALKVMQGLDSTVIRTIDVLTLVMAIGDAKKQIKASLKGNHPEDLSKVNEYHSMEYINKACWIAMGEYQNILKNS